MKTTIKFFAMMLMTGMMVRAQESIHDFNFKLIDGTQKSFADFKGKPILIVNTASECGYTPQYEALQSMHELYEDKLVIIGFPANNFGSQEPGNNSEIQTFCKKNYGVTFLMAEKISVKGDDMDSLFRWLCNQTGASFDGGIRWNFEKFVVDGNGKLVERFRSGKSPNDDEVIKALGL